MAKLIAVDIDDVLSDHAKAFIEYSNKVYGTNYKFDDYHEHWAQLWNIDNEELERRVGKYHNQVLPNYRPKEGAFKALCNLAETYDLVVITSRKSVSKKITQEWIEKYYPGIFKGIYHAGIWDVITKSSINATKALLCRELKVDYLIDDQLKHCVGSAQFGIISVLFGDYSWNRMNKLPRNIIRCKDWAEVILFFHAQS